jgi:hypothetical protein
MNLSLKIAAGLMVLTIGAHVFGGGPEYHAAYQDVLPTAHLASMAAVLWHAVTVSLIVFACALIWLVRFPSLPLAVAISAMQLGWAVLFLIYGLSMLGSPWPMPQWIIFIAVPLLTLYGTQQRQTR